MSRVARLDGRKQRALRPRGARGSGHRKVALALAVVLAASGCGFVNTGDDGTSDKLSVYVSTEQIVGVEPLAKAFEEDSDITVDDSSAVVDDMNQKLRVQITSGTAADVYRVSPGFSSPVAVGPLGKENELADLSDEKWVSDLTDETRTLAEYDGKVLAYPMGRNTLMMAYNKKVFADADLEPPTTWSEFVAACEKLKSKGKTPIAAGFTGGVTLQFWPYALASTMIYADQPDIDQAMADGKTSLSKNKKWKAVFDRFTQLRDAGFFTKDALGVPPEQSLQAVAKGDAAMTLTASATLPQLYDFGGGSDEFGVFALPATENAEDTHLPMAPDFVAVNAKAKNQDAAKEFLRFASKPENVTDYADAVSTIPGLGTDQEFGSSNLSAIEPLLKEERTTPYANYVWPNADVQQTLLSSGQKLVDKSMSVDELLAAMDKDYAKGTP